MGLILRYAVPRMIPRGEDSSLTLDIYDDATETQATATAATVQILDGSDEVVGATAATSLGPPASYSLAGTVHTSRNLSDRWLEKWRVTYGGVVYLLQRPAYLVRTPYTPTVTQADLVRRRHDLPNFFASGQVSWADKCRDADERVERALIAKGRRPQLIFDAWALREAEFAAKLSAIYDDLASSLGDGRYREDADRFEAAYLREIASVSFRYDAGESGTIDTNEQVTSSVPIMLSAGVPRSRGWCDV